MRYKLSTWLCVSVTSWLFDLAFSDSQLPLFDPDNCHNMCFESTSCPDNAACMPVTGTSRCGVCVCTFGFEPVNGLCERKMNKFNAPTQPLPPASDKQPSAIDTAPTEVETTSTSTSTTTTLANTPPQPPGTSEDPPTTSEKAPDTEFLLDEAPDSLVKPKPSEQPWLCTEPNTECGIRTVGAGGDENDASLFTLHTETVDEKCRNSTVFAGSIKCEHMQGGSSCVGECFEAEPAVVYCMCPYQRTTPSCHVIKRGTCQDTQGREPSALFTGKRYRHRRHRHTGSVYARHFVPNIDHCMRLCEWAGFSSCRSFNFGVLNGRTVCELLSVNANAASPLHKWLTDDANWTYVIPV